MVGEVTRVRKPTPRHHCVLYCIVWNHSSNHRGKHVSLRGYVYINHSSSSSHTNAEHVSRVASGVAP